MDMFGLSIVNLAKNKLDYLSEKQKVVATNIANANTPGYVAQDVEEPNFAGMVKNNISASTQMAEACLPQQDSPDDDCHPCHRRNVASDGVRYQAA